jgi:hypothetical protein
MADNANGNITLVNKPLGCFDNSFQPAIFLSELDRFSKTTKNISASNAFSFQPTHPFLRQH